MSAETSHLKVEAHEVSPWCLVPVLRGALGEGDSGWREPEALQQLGGVGKQQPGAGREAMEIGGCRKGDFSELSMRKW